MPSKNKYPFAEVEAKRRKIRSEQAPSEPVADASRSRVKHYVFAWPAQYASPSACKAEQDAAGEDADASLARRWLVAETTGRFQKHRAQGPVSPWSSDGFSPGVAADALGAGKEPTDVAREHRERVAVLERALGLEGAGDLVETSDPAYYRFSQWIFLQLLRHGLAARVTKRHDVCLKCDRKCRVDIYYSCPVCQGELKVHESSEWQVDISAYGDKLASGLQKISSEADHIAQRELLGGTSGCEVRFPVSRIFNDEYEELTVFTQHVERLFGVTFLLVDPYHPILETILDPANEDDLSRYRERLKKGAEPRMSAVRTGGFALNPATLRRIPILCSPLANAPLTGGVVLGVPAHDTDLFELARRLKLPILEVIHNDKAKFNTRSKLEEPWLGGGVLTNSGPFTSLPVERGREKIIAMLSSKGGCRTTARYRLSTLPLASASGWGPPVPVVHCASCGLVPVAEAELPVDLPPRQVGESAPVAVKTPCPACNEPAVRDGETLLPWIGNSWSFVRCVLPELDGGVPGFRDLAAPGTRDAEDLPEGDVAEDVEEGDQPSVASAESSETVAGDVPAAEGAGESAEKEILLEDLDPLADSALERTDPEGAAPDPGVDESAAQEKSTATPEGKAPEAEEEKREEDPEGAPDEEEEKREEDLEEAPDEDTEETPAMGEGQEPQERPPETKPFVAADFFLPVDAAFGAGELGYKGLLATRFVTKFLHAQGHLGVDEPFVRFESVGRVVPSVTKSFEPASLMGLAERHGADAVRLWLLFSGPLGRAVSVDPRGVRCMRRLLDRIWHQMELRREHGKFVSRRMLVQKHFLIHDVTQRLSQWKFHTAVAAIMKFIRFLERHGAPEDMDRVAMRTFIILLSPFAPFMAEELWSHMEEEEDLPSASWPIASDELIHPPEREFLVLVDGKVRDRMQQPSDLESEKLESRARERSRIREFIGSRNIEKVVVVPQKLVNIVTAKEKK